MRACTPRVRAEAMKLWRLIVPSIHGVYCFVKRPTVYLLYNLTTHVRACKLGT